MSIHQRSILAVSATLIVLVAVLALTLGRVTMTGFRQVEDEDTRKNVSRVIDAIDVQLLGIENSLFTWTQWDPAYRFMEDHNQGFIDENISSTAYTGMKINFLIFVDPRGATPISGGYDLQEKKDLAVPEDLLALLKPGSALLSNSDTNQSIRGLVNLKNGPLLIAAAPVTDTAGTAPAKGHIVFARSFDDEAIRGLAETTHVGVSIDKQIEPATNVRVVELNKTTIQGITNLKDIGGAEILKLTVSVSRAIYEQATRSLWVLVASIIGIGCVFGVLILWVIRILVLRRVLYMSRMVGEMTQSLDFSRRLEVQGDDEISALMNSINGMACAVSEVLAETKRAG